MGLIKTVVDAAKGAAVGVASDQWKEYFYCDSIPEDVLITKGFKKVSDRSVNTNTTENIISDGAIIAVNNGQCMLIVEQGKVVDYCSEPGEYKYDASTEPSLFGGELGQDILNVFKNIGKRFTFGGEAPKDQRIYFVNRKEIPGNKYGTPNPVPFRVVDTNIGLDMDISIRCFGEYSYHITNPILFYTNVSGNVAQEYTREQIEGQMKTELLTALQPAFAKISAMGIRYSELPNHTMEMADALNEVLSEKWANLRGIKILSFGISSVTASEEDEDTIKELQKSAVFRNPGMAAAHMVEAQAEAMKAAAANENAGPAMAFMGMNMAQQAGGINATNLFAMDQQNKAQQAAQQQATAQAATAQSADGWTCPCGAQAKGNFCTECGAKKPQAGWTCACGSVNEGNFCSNCGAKKPTEDWTCACGAENKGKFCSNCGAKRPE